MSPGISCKLYLFDFTNIADAVPSRTYDDEDQGEDIRQGFDPGKVSPDFGSESANEDGEPDRREETSDSRSGYNDLDDRNVWRGSPSAK